MTDESSEGGDGVAGGVAGFWGGGLTAGLSMLVDAKEPTRGRGHMTTTWLSRAVR